MKPRIEPRWRRLRALLRRRDYRLGVANMAQGRTTGADRVLSYLNGRHAFFDGGPSDHYPAHPYKPCALMIVDWRRGYDDARKGREADPAWWLRR